MSFFQTLRPILGLYLAGVALYLVLAVISPAPGGRYLSPAEGLIAVALFVATLLRDRRRRLRPMAQGGPRQTLTIALFLLGLMAVLVVAAGVPGQDGVPAYARRLAMSGPGFVIVALAGFVLWRLIWMRHLALLPWRRMGRTIALSVTLITVQGLAVWQAKASPALAIWFGLLIVGLIATLPDERLLGRDGARRAPLGIPELLPWQAAIVLAIPLVFFQPVHFGPVLAGGIGSLIGVWIAGRLGLFDAPSKRA